MGVNYWSSVSSSAWSLGLFKFLLFFPIFEGWGLMQLAEKWESTTEVLCHHQLDLSDYLSFCYFFPIFEGWGLMQLAEKWESTTEVLCHHQLDLSDYLSFCYFFPNFWRLRADATCWKMGVNYWSSVSSSAWSLGLFKFLLIFFPIFEGWGLTQLLKFCVIISLISRII